jgi:uncharacterized DUF497 family protein
MVLFEWDESKAASNLRKHRVSFADALLVVSDPYALIEDDRVVDDEMRWQMLGLTGTAVLVLVVHTVRTEAKDEIIRIISARKATWKERERYDENRAKEFSL